MGNITKITLGDMDFECRRLNLGQIEDLADFWSMQDEAGFDVDANGARLTGKAKIGRTLDIATIALRRSAPPIEDIRNIECSLTEIQSAIVAIYTLSAPVTPGEPRVP